MTHDSRLSGVSPADLNRRRIGGLAALLCAASLIVGLALATPTAEAPEIAASTGPSVAAPHPQPATAQAPAETAITPQMSCASALADPRDCMYY